MMTNSTKFSIFAAILLWASAYVGIRAVLHDYSPAGLALLRYLVASVCLAVIYYRLPARSKIAFRDKCALLAIGSIGIGVYNLTLNYGEMGVSSGVTSFIVSMAPLISAMLAIAFFGEELTKTRALGFLVSMMGIACITIGETGGFHWSVSMLYLACATVSASCFIVMQKPFLSKYQAIEATTYIIWGGTLFLMINAGQMLADVQHASWHSTFTVIYLGVFPAALGYLAWTYALKHLPLSRAGSFLYLIPFVTTLIGWLWLNEMPAVMSLIGGAVAVMGVFLINRSYRLIKE